MRSAHADAFDAHVDEEIGGPFVTSTAAAEVAEDDDDPTNPPDATREPFPTT
jgi:hypothetical protein